MGELAIHPLTATQLASHEQMPSHAILLLGPAGSGKLTAAKRLAENILGLAPGNFDKYQYGQVVKAEDGKSIGIDTARQMERFLNLKVPGTRSIDRIVIIEASHLLTPEAQNALLKTLEEPPTGTILLLTATHEQALLPTIRSRAQNLQIRRPAETDLRRHFMSQGFAETDITQAYAMSGGLPGLMQALLSEDEHPLRAAAQQARQLLGQTLFERLMTIDALSKQRELAAGTVTMLQQMAHLSLQNATGAASKRWQKILQASYEAADALQSSAQLKLVLTDMVLRF